MMEQIQRIPAIPDKGADTRLASHRTVEEIQAILNAPAPYHREGIHDRAMLHLCFDSGFRVPKPIGLRIADLALLHNICDKTLFSDLLDVQ